MKGSGGKRKRKTVKEGKWEERKGNGRTNVGMKREGRQGENVCVEKGRKKGQEKRGERSARVEYRRG